MTAHFNIPARQGPATTAECVAFLEQNKMGDSFVGRTPQLSSMLAIASYVLQLLLLPMNLILLPMNFFDVVGYNNHKILVCIIFQHSCSSEGISFNHSFISDLTEFEPFLLELDITTRVPASPSSTSDTEDENDPFIVEKIEN